VSLIRIGIQIGSLKLPLKKALLTASKLGATGVELDARTDVRPSDLSGTAVRQLRKLLDDCNLRVVAIRFQTRRGYNIESDLDRRIDATKDAMRMAVDLHCPVVVNQVGRIEPFQRQEAGANASTDDSTPLLPDSKASSGEIVLPARTTFESNNTPDPNATLQAVLSDLGQFGQKVGVRLACETGSESLSTMSQFLNTLPGAVLGVALNPGNLILNDFGLEDLGKVARDVVLVHAKDGVRDLARGRGVEVPLGQGTAEFPLIAAHLSQYQYNGFFVIEREQMEDPVDEIAQSIEYLRNAIEY
jgi:sugar phosphate isomerase/epimerase